MGILHSFVQILAKIDPNNERWKNQQIERALRIDVPEARSSAIADIETAFANKALDYARKLYLIENCIYGVDIQPIAIQISKLRFFISLIVDQPVARSLPNFGIKPLPNLETRFIAADTLTSLSALTRRLEGSPAGAHTQSGARSQSRANPHTYAQPDLLDSALHSLETKLQSIRHRIFSEKHPPTKRSLRQQDKATRLAIQAELAQAGWSERSASRLAQWDPYDQNATSNWYDSEWMFGLKTGFDIVIGNPPYIQLQKDGGALAQRYANSGYASYARTGDIYTLFYERGIQLLRPTGRLCYITSNKWMRSGYGRSLRQFFLAHHPTLLVDLGPNIFESATVDTNILLINKRQSDVRGKADVIGSRQSDEAGNGEPSASNQPTPFYAATLQADDATDLPLAVAENAVELGDLSDSSWYIASKAEQALKRKIDKIGVPLRESDVKIYRGLVTGLNSAFIVDQATYQSLIASDPNSADLLKPLLRGRDVKQYKHEWAGLYLITSGYDTDVPTRYPAIYQHLLQFKTKAEKRQDKGKNWYNLRACSYYPEFDKEKIIYPEFDKEKIIYPETTKQANFYLDTQGKFYAEKTNFIMTGTNLKYLLALLSSKLLSHAYYKYYAGTTLAHSAYQYNKHSLLNLPIPPITPQTQPTASKIETLVNTILTLTNSPTSPASANLSSDSTPSPALRTIATTKTSHTPDPNTLRKIAQIQTQIDHHIYNLYSLTPAEIALIEPKP